MLPVAQLENNTAWNGRIYLHFCAVGGTLLKVESHEK
jgi:hypothetical protein